jgi:thioredoxin reductase (NADPH)
MTTYVENFPGFAKGIGGLKLMMDMLEQVRNLGVEIKSGLVSKITNNQKTIFKSPKGTSGLAQHPNSKSQHPNFLIDLEDGQTLETKSVIVTTGAKAKWLGLPKEMELIGKGVSSCATCDGMFFRDKVVAVVGGGDVAGEDTSFLAKFASKIYLIHRRDTFRMQPAVAKKITDNPKIEIIWNNVVVDINFNNQKTSSKQVSITNDQVTNEKLENIKIKNNKTGEEKILEVDGLFVAIGHDPATSFVKELVELKEGGQIIVGKNSHFPSMASMPGIFAAGDCVDDVYRQAIIAAGDGAKAGMDAERWLGEK